MNLIICLSLIILIDFFLIGTLSDGMKINTYQMILIDMLEKCDCLKNKNLKRIFFIGNDLFYKKWRKLERNILLVISVLIITICRIYFEQTYELVMECLIDVFKTPD